MGPEVLVALIAAVLAVVIDTGSLAMSLVDVVISTHALPGRKLLRGLALGADETVKQLFGILLVNADTRAMVPILAATVAEDHHAMIIRPAADTILSTIVALGVGRRGRLGRGSTRADV